MIASLVPTASATSSVSTFAKRILLVDDHQIFREGLKSIVAQIPHFTVCGEAHDGTAAMSAFRRLQPDMVVLDLSLPDGDGFALIEKMRADQAVAILVISMHDSTHDAVRALKAGAKGYVTKSENLASIVTALHEVAADRTYVSPAFSRQLIFRVLRSAEEGSRSPVDALTAREREVLAQLGEGLSTREIAESLQLSPKTVETHRAHIKDKLSFPSATSMVRFAADWVAHSG